MNLQQLEALPPDELRIKVAEALGVTNIEYCGREEGWLGKPPGSDDDAPLPDWPNDLNACHDMEKFIEWKCVEWFGEEGDWSAPSAYVGHLRRITKQDEWCMVCATARQRCIAFLLTVSK